MEEQDRIESTDEDVEAHKRKALKANDEGGDESAGEDDVELHAKSKKVL